MIKSKQIDVYEWSDIQIELCKTIGIENEEFRNYHRVIGGHYKDLWHVCLETIIPNNMTNDSLVTLFATDDQWYDDEERWKNIVLTSWNSVYVSMVGVDNDPGIYVNFSW